MAAVTTATNGFLEFFFLRNESSSVNQVTMGLKTFSLAKTA